VSVLGRKSVGFGSLLHLAEFSKDRKEFRVPQGLQALARRGNESRLPGDGAKQGTLFPSCDAASQQQVTKDPSLE
jgi:hypothetical protein